MKTYILLFTVLWSAVISDAAIRFVGYGKLDGAYHFALCDTEKSVGCWVAIGGEFSGYKLKGYDNVREELTLANAEGEMVVKLVEARIKEDRRWDSSRSQELLALLRDMMPQMGKPQKILTVDDFIAVASSYGLVIDRYTVENDVEVIHMAPPTERASESGAIQKTSFSIQLKGRNELRRRKLTITVPKPNQALVPTPLSVPPAAGAPVSPSTGAAHR